MASVFERPAMLLCCESQNSMAEVGKNSISKLRLTSRKFLKSDTSKFHVWQLSYTVMGVPVFPLWPLSPLRVAVKCVIILFQCNWRRRGEEKRKEWLLLQVGSGKTKLNVG